MEKQKLRLMRVKRKHILARLLLSLAAVVILLPVVLTALYSFFSPNEIKAFMQTRRQFRRGEPDGDQAFAEHVFPQPILQNSD